MSECKAYRRELSEAADGGALSDGASAHAALCGACGGELRERQSLRALVGSLGKVEAPADFEFRLRARLASAKSSGGRGGGLRFIYGFAPVAAAACFLVISATLYFRQAARDDSANPPAGPAVAARNVEAPEAPPLPARAAASPVGGDEKAVGKVLASVKHTGNKPTHGARARDRRAGGFAHRSAGRASLARNTTDREFGPERGGARQGVTIALKAPAEPLRMILRDENGARRVVPMRAVSFGSQDLLAREATPRQGGAADVEGVW